jgi:glutamate dehydrogenase (NADP+)
MHLEHFLLNLERQNPGELEYLQSVREFLMSVEGQMLDDFRFEANGILQRLVEPDRIIVFKVPWENDQGKIMVNRGIRVQFNNALGPYKGGLRFHPALNLSTVKMLAFEQVFKNSLTSLPLGGAMGGSDFNPKGKTDSEMMRFCQRYMMELWGLVDEDVDIPGGDIGVGTREIGYLFGMYKKLSGRHAGVLTSKGVEWGGSLIRPEATGYGVIYFLSKILDRQGEKLAGKTVAVSGFGNVAWGVARKATELGAKVVTLSGPDGYVYYPEGLSEEQITFMLEMRATNEDIVRPFSYEFPEFQFVEGKKPWEVMCDVAIPCAIQNELDSDDARQLMANGCRYVVEGANLPCTMGAQELFMDHGIVFAPGKAANAGGVAVAGLEMAQNTLKLTWTAREVEDRLQDIMGRIHGLCILHGEQMDGSVNYSQGANLAGFMRVAEAMLDQGVV